MIRFIDWLKSKCVPEQPEPEEPLWKSGVHVTPNLTQRDARKRDARKRDARKLAAGAAGKITDGGPGKNVFIRNKYVREDTGTHETLKIVDDSLLESDEEPGADPYNTGRFDRSKSWESFRK